MSEQKPIFDEAEALRVQTAMEDKTPFNELQRQVKAWTDKNFPFSEPWEPLLGLIEEVGELTHACLKQHQGIRKEENHEARKIDAVGDILVYLIDFCNRALIKPVVVLDELQQHVVGWLDGEWLVQLFYLSATVSKLCINEELRVLNLGSTLRLVEHVLDSLARFCNASRISMQYALALAWGEVKQRDWTKERKL